MNSQGYLTLQLFDHISHSSQCVNKAIPKRHPNASIPFYLIYLIYPSTPHYRCLIPLPRHLPFLSFYLISFRIYLLLNSSRWCLAGSLGRGDAIQGLEGGVDLLVVLLHCADHLLSGGLEGAAVLSGCGGGGGGGGGAVAGLCGCHCDCFVCFVLVVCVKRSEDE
jgi:hypothetical protein